MKTKLGYTPILKDKKAEMGALKELSSRIWNQMTPLIELSPPEDAQSPADVGKEMILAIEKATLGSTTVMLDFSALGGSALLPKLIVDGLEKLNRWVIPVCPYSPNTTLKNLSKLMSDQIAVRVCWRQLSASLEDDLKRFVQLNAIDPTSAHLILDIGEVSVSNFGALTATVPFLASTLSKAGKWQTLTLAGTAIPKTFSVQPNVLITLPRLELQLWKEARSLLSKTTRRFDFGDYCITNPELVDFDPQKMSVSPKIIYANEDLWLVLKGRSSKQYGWSQCKEMCAAIRKHKLFLNPEFSAGSERIARCAAGTVGVGNSTVWKQAGTNHHITLVADQIASLASS